MSRGDVHKLQPLSPITPPHYIREVMDIIMDYISNSFTTQADLICLLKLFVFIPSDCLGVRSVYCQLGSRGYPFD